MTMKRINKNINNSEIIDLRNKNLFETLQEIVSLSSNYTNKGIKIKSNIPNIKNVLKDIPNLPIIEVW